MSESSSFLIFCKMLRIGEWITDPQNKESYFIIDSEEFHKLISFNMVFDGTKGGLVIGKLHIEGGIHLLRPYNNTDSFFYCGEMEGWEYLSSPLSNLTKCRQFERINNSFRTGPPYERTDFEIPYSCKLIDTLNVQIPIIKMSNEGQFIVNRWATRECIYEIMKIEKQ